MAAALAASPVTSTLAGTFHRDSLKTLIDTHFAPGAVEEFIDSLPSGALQDIGASEFQRILEADKVRIPEKILALNNARPVQCPYHDLTDVGRHFGITAIELDAIGKVAGRHCGTRRLWGIEERDYPRV